MGEFEPSIVEFIGERKFKVVRFRTRVMETVVVDLAQRTVALELLDWSVAGGEGALSGSKVMKCRFMHNQSFELEAPP
jgi:hypothetical protein